MTQENKEIPLSESNVSLRLADIQRRCSELIEGSVELTSLTLEDPVPGDTSNPYNRG